jgi:hypothetical protein
MVPTTAVTAPRSGPSSSDSGGGNADHRDLGCGYLSRVGCRPESCVAHLRNIGVGQVVDVRPALVECVDDGRVDVEPQHGQAGSGGFLGEWEAHVSEPDGGDISDHVLPLRLGHRSSLPLSPQIPAMAARWARIWTAAHSVGPAVLVARPSTDESYGRACRLP